MFDLRQTLALTCTSNSGSANFCTLATFQRCPVNVRKFWGQLPKNILVGNVWQTNSTTGMERV